MQLALGTAQFGLDYGITNSSGQVNLAEVEKILDVANSNGIKILDTANQYGDSEKVLGKALATRNSFSVITKSPKFTDVEAAWKIDLNLAFTQSLRELGVEKFYAYLFHNAVGINQDTYAFLQKQKESGLVERIGISAYSPDEVVKINEEFPLDIVQVPLNLWDQRILAPNFMDYCRNNSIEIHVRSLFLQGVLLQNAENYPQFMRERIDNFGAISKACKELDRSPQIACLSILKANPQIAHGVIGVTKADELEANIEAYQTDFETELSQFAIDDELVLNPAKWPQKERQ